MNIQSVLEKCAQRYDFIEEFYADLSEAAHPNHEGLLMGYNTSDRENYVEHFSNRWAAIYSKTHEEAIMIVAETFEHEYNEEWPKQFSALEQWVVKNDVELEATKNDRPK